MSKQADDDFDHLRMVINVLRNFCQEKKTLKQAMPVLQAMTGLSEERIINIVKKHFKDKYD